MLLSPISDIPSVLNSFSNAFKIISSLVLKNVAY
jgi:hypothetical protein